MPEEPKDEETEETPQGLRVPIPKRGDFFRNLAKVAKSRKKDSPDVARSTTNPDAAQDHPAEHGD